MAGHKRKDFRTTQQKHKAKVSDATHAIQALLVIPPAALPEAVKNVKEIADENSTRFANLVLQLMNLM